MAQAGIAQRIELVQAQQADAASVGKGDDAAAQGRVGAAAVGVVRRQRLQRQAVVLAAFFDHAQHRAAGGRVEGARVHRGGHRPGCIG